MADAPAAAATPPKDEFEDAFNQITLDLEAPVVQPKPDAVAEGADAAAAARAAEGGTPAIEIEGALPDPTKVKADGTIDGEVIPPAKDPGEGAGQGRAEACGGRRHLGRGAARAVPRHREGGGQAGRSAAAAPSRSPRPTP
jgi:hypothetical protein